MIKNRLPKGLPFAVPLIILGMAMIGNAANNSGPLVSGSLSEGMSSLQSPFLTLLGLLGSAFLGGLILNLMPCVLPVLSLKIFDFMKRAGQSRVKSLSHALSFTLGVLVSFWSLALLLLILRKGGMFLGWGYQLQSPAFVVILAAAFFFFSLSLFGVFEIGYLFTRLGSTGEAKESEGHGASFLAGVTATIVATPCTAPFMGTALAYAFTQSIPMALLIFTALGIGMASPYILLASFPGLMKVLPKPGAWMEHFKQFMGFPLLATSIWLAWILGRQLGVDAMAILLFLLLAAGVSSWVVGKWMALHHPGHVRITGALVAAIIFIPSLFLVMRFIKSAPPIVECDVPLDRKNVNLVQPNSDTGASKSINWEPWSPARQAALISEGYPVFVDYTADWCLSCKVNEKVALTSQEVIEALKKKGVHTLKADWTQSDSVITKSLAAFGRSSIPVYILYDGQGGHTFLPEVLTPGIVLSALKGLKDR